MDSLQHIEPNKRLDKNKGMDSPPKKERKMRLNNLFKGTNKGQCPCGCNKKCKKINSKKSDLPLWNNQL